MSVEHWIEWPDIPNNHDKDARGHTEAPDDEQEGDNQ